LTSIFLLQAASAGYRPTEAALHRVREVCALMKGSEDPATFGNAREIRNLFEDTVAQQAARIVAQAGQGRQPTPEELQRLEPSDIHWDLLGDESLRDTLTGEPLRTVAVHELGHALVGHLVDGPPPVLVTTIPSAHGLGRAFFAENESPVLTRAQLLGRAARALAGRAAEEVVFGVLTAGAAHDLEVAERTALELLRTGMSEETTHASLEEYASTDDGARGSWRSERTREEVGELLQEAYALALQLVRDHEPALRLAVDRLVERRTLNRDELGILFGPRPGGRGPAPA
jgi:cell division protease FtsH